MLKGKELWTQSGVELVFKGIKAPPGSVAFHSSRNSRLDFDSGELDVAVKTFCEGNTGFPILTYSVVKDSSSYLREKLCCWEVIEYRHQEVDYMCPLTGERFMAIQTCQLLWGSNSSWRLGRLKDYVEYIFLPDGGVWKAKDRPRSFGKAWEQRSYSILKSKSARGSICEEDKRVFFLVDGLASYERRDGKMYFVSVRGEVEAVSFPEDLGEAEVIRL